MQNQLASLQAQVNRLRGDTDSLDDEIADFCATNSETPAQRQLRQRREQLARAHAPAVHSANDDDDDVNDDDDDVNDDDDEGTLNMSSFHDAGSAAAAAANTVLVQGLSQDELDMHNLAMAVDFSRVMNHDERVLFFDDFFRAFRDPRTMSRAFEASTSRRSSVRRASIIEEVDLHRPLLPEGNPEYGHVATGTSNYDSMGARHRSDSISSSVCSSISSFQNVGFFGFSGWWWWCFFFQERKRGKKKRKKVGDL